MVKMHTGTDKFLSFLSYLSFLNPIILLAFFAKIELPFLFFVIGILGILPWWIIPILNKKPWVHNNGKQGLFIWIIMTILILIPLIGWVLALIYLVFTIIAIVRVFQGAPFYKMPVLNRWV